MRKYFVIYATATVLPWFLFEIVNTYEVDNYIKIEYERFVWARAGTHTHKHMAQKSKTRYHRNKSIHLPLPNVATHFFFNFVLALFYIKETPMIIFSSVVVHHFAQNYKRVNHPFAQIQWYRVAPSQHYRHPVGFTIGRVYRLTTLNEPSLYELCK